MNLLVAVPNIDMIENGSVDLINKKYLNILQKNNQDLNDGTKQDYINKTVLNESQS
jgi:hypothetical protein